MTSTVTRRELYVLYDKKLQRYFTEDKESGRLVANLRWPPDARTTLMPMPAMIRKGVSLEALQQRWEVNLENAEVRTINLTTEIEFPEDQD